MVCANNFANDLKQKILLSIKKFPKLGICYKVIGELDLAVENLKKGIELTKKNVTDLEIKQKWLSIAKLFLSELKPIEVNH